MSVLPQKAVRLVRISDARGDDTHGVDGQVGELGEYAERIGWQVGPRETHLIIENDTSAFKRRMVCAVCLRPVRIRRNGNGAGMHCTCPPLPGGEKRETVLRTWRPGFRQALAMLRSGQADGLLAVHLDRVCRDPRDLEDLIDVVEASKPRIPCESLTGSVRLANDSDVFGARILCAVGNQESRDKARRVAASHRRRAAEGRYRGGRRRYGFEADGTTPRMFAQPIVVGPGEQWNGEQDVIRWASERLLARVSLRFLVRYLIAHDVPTVTGTEWSTGSLRDILMRPSNAGISVYTDPATGKRKELAAGQWEPIVSRDIWDAVCAVLTDPARKTTPGNKPKWIGSLIYRCGACALEGRPLTDSHGHTPIKVAGGRANNPTYQCCAASRGQSHLRRTAGTGSLIGDLLGVDDLISRVIVGRMKKPDAASLLAIPAKPSADIIALRAEQAALRERLDEQARLHARRIIDDRQLEAGSIELRGKLDVVEAQLAQQAGVSPLAGIAGRADAAAVWTAMDLGTKREVIRKLVTVTLLPQSRPGRQPGGGYFDPESVLIEWRESE